MVRSAYNNPMKTRKSAFLLGAVLFAAALPCSPQSTADRQQQIASHARQAQAYLKENKLDLAASEFGAIVALDPNNVDSRGNLGVLLFFQGKYVEAIPQLRAALKLRSPLWKIPALLGVAEKRTGGLQEARGDLEKAFPQVEEEKIRVETGMELIDLYSRSGDLDKAAPIVSVLRTLEPTNVDVLCTAYRIYSELTDESILSMMLVASKSAHMHELADRTHRRRPA